MTKRPDHSSEFTCFVLHAFTFIQLQWPLLCLVKTVALNGMSTQGSVVAAGGIFSLQLMRDLCFPSPEHHTTS